MKSTFDAHIVRTDPIYMNKSTFNVRKCVPILYMNKSTFK